MTQTALLVVARSAGMIFRAPGFAHPSVPAPLRAGFALALALAVAPHVPQASPFDAAAFAVAIAGETLLGALLGTSGALLYDAAYYAGRLVDDYVGVRASVPTANVTSAQAFGRLWSSVFLAGFFLLDGYLPVVDAFAASFAHVPAGVLVSSDALVRVAPALPATIVRAALGIAAPAIAVGLAVQIALAATARVVPRFGSFSLSFPLVFGAALLATVAGVPLLAPAAGHPWLVLPWESRP